MKRYRILESWHNGSDNAENECYCVSESKENVKELFEALCDKFQSNGLGPDFPSGKMNVQRNRESVVFFLGDKLTSSEYWRSFEIVEENSEWHFVHTQKFPDSAGENYAGVLSNGKRCLFYHDFSQNEGEPAQCHIYTDITMEPASEIKSFLSTQQNYEEFMKELNTTDGFTTNAGYDYVPFEESGAWKCYDVKLKNTNIVLAAYGADIDKDRLTVINLHLDLSAEKWESLQKQNEAAVKHLKPFLQDGSSDDAVSFIIPVDELDESTVPVILKVYWAPDDDGYTPGDYFPMNREKYLQAVAHGATREELTNIISDISGYLLYGYMPVNA